MTPEELDAIKARLMGPDESRWVGGSLRPSRHDDAVALVAEVERSPNYALLVKADRYRTALEEIADWGGMWIAAGAAQALVDEARAALEAK